MFKRLSLYSLLLLVIPCATWISHWEFQGIEHLQEPLDLPLFYITQTSTFPFSIITCIVFTLLLMALCVKKHSLILVGILCLISVLGTQSLKGITKEIFAEPRPYVVHLLNEDAKKFYAMSKKERKNFVQEAYKNSLNQFAAKHHAHEVGYAFPSGHSIFAASWLLLFCGLLLGNKSTLARFIQGALALWALLMLFSRLRLGMHYPIDLFTSIILAWIFHIALFLWAFPYIERFVNKINRRLFKKSRSVRKVSRPFRKIAQSHKNRR